MQQGGCSRPDSSITELSGFVAQQQATDVADRTSSVIEIELVKNIPFAALVRDVPSWLVSVPDWLQCINATAALSESVARQLTAVLADRPSCC